MNVNGKIYLFKNVRKNAKGEEKVYYLTSISRKVEDKIERCHLNVEFSKENFPEATLSKLELDTCYTLELEEAFLSFSKGKDNEKFIFLKIMKAKVLEKKKVEPKKATPSEELPF